MDGHCNLYLTNHVHTDGHCNLYLTNHVLTDGHCNIYLLKTRFKEVYKAIQMKYTSAIIVS